MYFCVNRPRNSESREEPLIGVQISSVGSLELRYLQYCSDNNQDDARREGKRWSDTIQVGCAFCKQTWESYVSGRDQ